MYVPHVSGDEKCVNNCPNGNPSYNLQRVSFANVTSRGVVRDAEQPPESRSTHASLLRLTVALLVARRESLVAARPGLGVLARAVWRLATTCSEQPDTCKEIFRTCVIENMTYNFCALFYINLQNNLHSKK